VDRRSSKHGPRLDDELKREVESIEKGAPVEAHVQEGREKEPPGEGEPTASVEPSLGGLPGDAVVARRELSRHLRLTVFPGTRDELVAEAKENDAPDAVLDALAKLEPGAVFGTMHQVWEALAGSSPDEPPTGRTASGVSGGTAAER
jgi:hypothetical protein